MTLTEYFIYNILTQGHRGTEMNTTLIPVNLLCLKKKKKEVGVLSILNEKQYKDIRFNM